MFLSTDQHDYENVPEPKVVICADTEEERDYLNVEPLHLHGELEILPYCLNRKLRNLGPSITVNNTN